MNIPFDLSLIVASFLIKPRMNILDWIPEDKLIWLSLNPNALHILEKNPDKIDWQFLSRNPNLLRCYTSFRTKS